MSSIIRFEVLKVVTMESTVFWDLTVCSVVGSLLTFERNTLPPSSWLRS
jgi:hypothetical protein